MGVVSVDRSVGEVVLDITAFPRDGDHVVRVRGENLVLSLFVIICELTFSTSLSDISNPLILKMNHHLLLFIISNKYVVT